MGKMNVMVVFGGRSGEHEVSLMSATSILKAINRNKYNIITVGITKSGIWKLYEGPIDEIQSGNWENIANKAAKDGGYSTNISILPTDEGNRIMNFGNGRIENIDVVFPVLHGPFGEDGTIQGLFEMMNIPYVGTGVLASSLAMDKAMTKKLLDLDGIPQAQYDVILFKEYKKDIEGVLDKIELGFNYPVFVKPANMGSSVGITKANNRDKLKEAIELAGKYDRKVVIEEAIVGREIECSILGNDEPIASLPAEIIPSAEFYDYNDKYFAGTSKFEIPANLPENVINEIRALSIKVYKLLDCSGLSRVDCFVEKGTNRILLNEVNTMPGFTKISMYPKMWEATGIKYEDLIDQLIELAIERFEERNN